MGIQHWGAFGGFQGRAGALVGRWKDGKNIISAIPHPSQTPATVAQVNQRTKFGMLVGFLRRMTGLIRVGFQNARDLGQTAFNAAFQENYYSAITGVAPNFTINYPGLMYSKGILSGAYNATVLIDTAATVKLSWTAQLATGIGSATDMATVVAYNPVKGQFVMLANAAARAALAYNLAVPPDFAGDDVHVWISMVRADGKMTSDSQYIGEFTIL